MIPKAIMIFSSLFSMGFIHKLCYCGKPLDKPLTGFRSFVFRWSYAILIKPIIFGFGYINLPMVYEDVDYSFYLGPDYKKHYKAPKRISTVVSNHISFLDILTLLDSPFFPSFATAHFVKKFPIGAFYVEALQGIYINRELPKESRS